MAVDDDWAAQKKGKLTEVFNHAKNQKTPPEPSSKTASKQPKVKTPAKPPQPQYVPRNPALRRGGQMLAKEQIARGKANIAQNKSSPKKPSLERPKGWSLKDEFQKARSKPEIGHKIGHKNTQKEQPKKETAKKPSKPKNWSLKKEFSQANNKSKNTPQR